MTAARSQQLRSAQRGMARRMLGIWPTQKEDGEDNEAQEDDYVTWIQRATGIALFVWYVH